MRGNGKSGLSETQVEAALAGDQDAMSWLYRSYAKAMLNTCYRIMNNEQDAEDVLQEAFVKAFANLKAYRREASFGAWLKRIVVNHAINALKKKKIEWISLEANMWESVTTRDNDFWVDDVYTADDAYEALQKLPDGYRTIFSLYLLEGYDHAEISEIMGIAVSTSISQYNRAKKKLRILLSESKKSNGSDREFIRESA